MFFLRLHNRGVILAQIFWRLCLFPFGLVVMQSGFIPRSAGVAAITADYGYVINSSVSLFLPPSENGVGQLAKILGVGEFALLWLLIWGAKEQPSRQAIPAPAAA